MRRWNICDHVLLRVVMIFFLSLKLSPVSLTVAKYSQVWTPVHQERALILELILYACKIKKNKNHCTSRSWKLFFFTKLLNQFCNIQHKFRKVTTTPDFTTATTFRYTTRSPETTTTDSPLTTTTQGITTMTATTDSKTELSTMTGIFY